MRNKVGLMFFVAGMILLGMLIGFFSIADIEPVIMRPEKTSVMTNFEDSIDRACLVKSFNFEGPLGCGSGALYADGWVVSAKHVVMSAESVIIEWADGTKEASYDIRMSKDYDVAFIKVERQGCFIPICVDLQDLDPVYCIGNPFCEIKHAILLGNVIRVDMKVPLWKRGTILDITSIGGMSGGACYHDGEFIGILVGFFPDRINSVTNIIPEAVVTDQYWTLIILGEDHVQANVSKQI